MGGAISVSPSIGPQGAVTINAVSREPGAVQLDAHDGEAGVALAEHPDFILMDIELPKISGIEVSRPRDGCGRRPP